VSTIPRQSSREAVARATARRERREARSRWWRFTILALAVLCVDQVVKAIVRARLEPGESWDVFPGFSISRVSNEGIAFGLFPGNQVAVAVLTVVALSGIAIAVAALARKHPFVAAGGGLLMGGSVSNLIDRLAHGGVTDYLDPAHWWAFNIADIAIVVGAALIIYGLLGADEPEDAAEHD
jgi:signal peptidase II